MYYVRHFFNFKFVFFFIKYNVGIIIKYMLHNCAEYIFLQVLFLQQIK